MLIVASGVCIGFLVFDQLQFQGAVARLNSELEVHSKRHWKRPVLSGKPIPGNAATEIWAALANVQPMSASQRASVAEGLYYGQWPPSAGFSLEEATVRATSRLSEASLRESTATSLRMGQGASMAVPDYERVVDGTLRVLAVGRGGTAAQCMGAATSAIRLGQDIIPGSPIEAISVSARITTLASAVLLRCAPRAAPGELRDTLRELRVLVQNPPPAAQGFRLAELLLGVEQARLGQISANWRPLAFAETVARRRRIMNEMNLLVDSSSAFPEGRYLAWLDTLRVRDARLRAAGRLDLADSLGRGVGFLYDYMRGEAALRATTVGIATMLSYARGGRMPERLVGLSDPQFADPFSGRPLLHRFSRAEHALFIWSLGEDLRDGGGADGWTAEAPEDVVVMVRLPKPAVAKRRARRNRSRSRRP